MTIRIPERSSDPTKNAIWLKMLVDAAPMALLVVRDGLITFVNQWANDLFGYVGDELIEQHVERLLPMRSHATATVTAFADPDAGPSDRLLATDASAICLGQRRNGTTFPAEIDRRPMETPFGSFSLFTVSVTDTDLVDPRHASRSRPQRIAHDEARDPLQFQSEPLRLPVENVREYAIYTLDPLGRVLTWNLGAERIKGYAESEIIGRDFSCFFSADDQQAGKPAALLISASVDGTCRDEGWRKRKNGTRFWANSLITALLGPDGAVCGFTKITRDETAVHETAQLLQHSEERFRTLVGGLKEHAVYMLDPLGNVVSWNEGAERIKQYHADEIIGKNFSVFFTTEDQQLGKPACELSLAASFGLFEEEGWRVRKDGTRFWAAIALTALRGPQNTLTGFAKVTKDESRRHAVSLELGNALKQAGLVEAQLHVQATRLEAHVAERTAELKKANAALEHSNIELQRFAYIASHDLQTPLRSVASFVQLLDATYTEQLDDRARDWFRRTSQAIRHMQILTNDLLEYAKLNAQAAPFRTVAMREVLDDVVSLLDASILESRAVVTCGGMPTVMADRSQVVHLLLNLIGNAIKYRGVDSPCVQVAAQKVGLEWIFSVRDNGIGIAPKYHQKIFEIFQRLHDQSEYPGTGIGLAVCRRVIQRHGGRLWVESSPGRGSTFFFTLLEKAKDPL